LRHLGCVLVILRVAARVRKGEFSGLSKLHNWGRVASDTFGA
jgi:hypothetical protein